MAFGLSQRRPKELYAVMENDRKVYYMFNTKEKIGFQVFMKQHYLPFIMGMVDSEIDHLQAEINKNSPAILITKDQIKFELFSMFLYVAEKQLPQIKGYDDRYRSRCETQVILKVKRAPNRMDSGMAEY